MARLPSSGPISASQIEVYAFSRGATAEFSMSASFQQGSYGTIFANSSGQHWPGYIKVGKLSDLSYADWYKYAKSKTVSLGSGQAAADDACNNVGGATTVYVDNNANLEDTEWAIPVVVGAGTYVYTNAQGTTTFDGQDQFYGYAIVGENYSVRISSEGLPTECSKCP